MGSRDPGVPPHIWRTFGRVQCLITGGLQLENNEENE